MDLFDLVTDRLVWMIPLILSITVHEWAHAASAGWLGDDTARLLGRNTLNPLAHVDPVGTLLLPVLGVPFGWAKPVPINPVRFRRGVGMKAGVLIVALAGPVSNAGMALFCWGILRVAAASVTQSIQSGLTTLIALNVGLAVFNLLPIPPLDGSRIVDSMMPARFRPIWNRFSDISLMVLVALFVIPLALWGMNLVTALTKAL